jgi:hypothetical protein
VKRPFFPVVSPRYPRPNDTFVDCAHREIWRVDVSRDHLFPRAAALFHLLVDPEVKIAAFAVFLDSPGRPRIRPRMQAASFEHGAKLGKCGLAFLPARTFKTDASRVDGALLESGER